MDLGLGLVIGLLLRLDLESLDGLRHVADLVAAPQSRKDDSKIT